MRTFFGALVSSVVCFNAAHATDFSCPKPMAIPDRWEERSIPPDSSFDPGVDVYDPTLTGYSSASLGTLLILRAASGVPAGSPGAYSRVDFPAVNRGAPLTGVDWYKKWLGECSPYSLFPADTLLVESGESDGVIQAFTDIFSQDPSAYWDGASVISQYAASPRLVTLLAYDPNYPPEPGRTTVILTKFLKVFVQSVGPSSAITVRIVDAAADVPVPIEPSTWGGLKRKYRN